VALLLGVAFFAVPFLEILVIIEIGTRIGWDSTVTILIVLSAGGAWLVKREGLDSWRRVQTGLNQGRMPTSDVVDAFLVLIAGVLLLCPGFITSACGIALIFPPVRARANEMTGRWLRRRVSHRVRTVGSRLGDAFTPRGDDRARAGWRPPPPGSSDFRAYRRPDEPADPQSGPKVWGARVRAPGGDDMDVIDVDGEEILFGPGELGPSGSSK
jgi:UPF0716 protein FxsA